MLRIVYAGSPQSKEKFFVERKSPRDLWLVSHIEAKRTLQNFFLEDQSTIHSKSVLRASEYWQWLFSVNCPEWRAVSESLVFTLLEQWFDESEIDVRFRNLEMFRHFFGQALPLMIDESNPLLAEWLATDPAREERLAGWLEQARTFWEFLREKKWIGRSWVTSWLGTRESLYLGEFEKYYVDLGLDIRQEEVEMILRIARDQDVTVIIPRAPWCERYGSSLAVYKKLIEAAEIEVELDAEGGAAAPVLRGFPSVLKETKAVVAEVRALLNDGVPASRIAVLSSNIEDYWDMLREHFLVEGIPVNKKYVLRAISLPSVQGWLARLNLARAEFDQAHLETFLFSDHENPLPPGKYIEFKKEFSHIYDAAEVRRYLQLPSARVGEAVLTLTEFVEFIMGYYWRGENREVVEDIVDIMAQDLRPGDSFPYDLWLKYLELVISRYEVEVRDADEDGVLLTNFSQADWAPLDYAFVLGCEQSRLREVTPTPLSAEDVARLEMDLGFYVQRSESLKKEFELRWFAEKNLQGLGLCHSQSDFDGQPQVAASFWLELEAVNETAAEVRAPTRWDAIMATELSSIQRELRFGAVDSETQRQKIALEFSLDGYQPVPIGSDISLSAGSLKKIFDCPFTFYVEKVLRLKDQGEFDLDVDPLFQGQIWHKMVEEIHRQYPGLELTRDQLSRLYDGAAESLETNSPLKRFWLQEKSRHLIIIQNFLELEREWRAKFPHTSTLATEASVTGFIGIEGDNVVLSPERRNEKFHAFNGRVDRVDRDQHGNLAVVDYKTSAAGLKAFKNWPQNGQFQMPLYALALEAGMANEVEAAAVKTASYFVFKDKKRGLGYILKDDAHGFGDLKEKSAQLVAEADRDAVFAGLMNEIKRIFALMHEGLFKAEPRDPKLCERCQWSLLCRSPHLK